MEDRDNKESASSRAQSTRPSEDALGGWSQLFPELDEPSAGQTDDDLVSPPIEAIPSSDFDRPSGLASGPPRTLPTPVPSGPPRTLRASTPPAKESAKTGGEADGGERKTRAKFEGNRLASALIPDPTERPPYAPRGYDPRPEHVPVIAAVFSALAPGAGQVYNGQDARGVQYGLRFMAIKPWIDSVRQALVYGERIRTYHEPRPMPGAFWRSLRYVLLFWLVVVGVGVCLSWLAQGIWETTQMRRHEAHQIEVADVVGRSLTIVQDARVEALSAVLEAKEELEPNTEFVMTDEERAKRLYIIGYEYCRRGDHRLCSEIMGRVIALQGASRNAFRLQTWASVQLQNSREREPIPDVGEVPTLAQFEFELEREVLGLPPTGHPPVGGDRIGDDEGNGASMEPTRSSDEESR